MLEGLDQMEWASLWACGWTTEIPQFLRALASPDKAVRQEVLKELPHRLVYQGGSILEATSYAVPVLLELLAAPVVEEKVDLLWLLATIVKGEPFLPGEGALGSYAQEASAPPGLQAALAKQWGWVQRSFAAVEQGVPLYRTFLAHPEAKTRMFCRRAPRALPRASRGERPSATGTAGSGGGRAGSSAGGGEPGDPT